MLWLVCGFWLLVFVRVSVGFLLPGKFISILLIIPVVDRPCLALARQCRKKKTVTQTQPLVHLYLRRSSRFWMAPSASHNVVSSLPSITLTPPRMFVSQPKNSSARRVLTNSYTRLNSEVVDCCRIYHLPPTSSVTTTPPTGVSHAPGPSNLIPAPALNVRPRLPAESRSRTPPGPAPSLFDYDTDFPHPIGAPPKGKGKGKEKGKGKGKGKRQKKR